MGSESTSSSSGSSSAQRNQALVTIVASVLIGAVMALAGSDGGLRLGGVPVVVWCAALAFVVNWVAYVPSYLLRSERAYDLVGSLTYLSVVALALVGGSGSSLSLLLGVLVAVWALRLGTFLVLRIRADGSDGRFDAIKTDPIRFLMSWTLQALWVVLTAGAALAAMTAAAPVDPSPWTVLGVAIWLVGFGVEAVADSQKRAFRADPANEGRFIASGLWAWSRHPNYFGEITLWVGVAVVALPALTGWQHLTLVSPLFVALLLTKVSGIPLLEARGRARWGDDPEYRAHLARTPVLVPRPPRRP
jgi:steroid 5-alpha reductase family enzyme